MEIVTLSALEEFTLCFWIKRGYDGALHGAIISYATAQEVKSLLVYVGSLGGLNLLIMDSRYAAKCYVYRYKLCERVDLQNCLQGAHYKNL